MGGMGFIENNKALYGSPAHPCGPVGKKFARGFMTLCRRTHVTIDRRAFYLVDPTFGLMVTIFAFALDSF